MNTSSNQIFMGSPELCPNCSTKEERQLASKLITQLREQIWASGLNDVIEEGCLCMPICTPRFYRILPELAVELLDSDPTTVILDVNPIDRYLHHHIPGAISLPRSVYLDERDSLPKSKTRTILVYAEDPQDSLIIGKLLALDQYLYVFTLIGGTDNWITSGYPIANGSRPATWTPIGQSSSRADVIHRAQAIVTYNLLGQTQNKGESPHDDKPPSRKQFK